MKIGLLAMSGIRVRDEELLALGLTLPGFVDRSQVIASLPSLGLLYLAAVTPPEHDLLYLEAESDGDAPAGVFECDLVAISTFSAQIFEAYAIADRLRVAGIKVAMGGLHVSVLPQEAGAHADYVVVGEGENVWPAVVDAAARGAPGRIFDASDFPPVDVADLPVPRYDLLEDRPYNRFTVQTTRGCPWRCEFCASSVMLRRGYRRRPVVDVIRDIRAIMAVREHPFLEFADDNTFVDKAWGMELCEALEPLRLKWFTETDVSVADDSALLHAMRKAGCRQVLIGLESPTPSDLDGVELRANRKAAWAVDYARSVRRIQEHGITVNGCFVLGLDGQRADIFQRVYDFALETSLYDVQITVLTPFPGTPLYARLEAEGRLRTPRQWGRCTLFDVNYEPLGMTAAELRSAMHWLARQLYSKSCTEERRLGYFRQARRYARAS